MVRYFIEGNLKFMGTLSLLFLVILSLSVFSLVLAVTSRKTHKDKIRNLTGYMKSLALFALVFGIFGQILGLLNIFNYLAGSEIDVASKVLARGIKITFYPTMYGIIIYLFSILAGLSLKLILTCRKP
jgi:hypothetical protein